MAYRSSPLACLFCVGAFAMFGIENASAQVVTKANWIWFDQGNPLQSAPDDTIYFRKSFDENYELQEAEIHITCDNTFVLFINGKKVGSGSDWKDGKVFDVKKYLVQGKNTIAVQAANQGGPAGLVAWLVRLTKPGNHYTVVTDGSWKCSKAAAENWREANFDDSKWSTPALLGEFGRPDHWSGITWNGKSDASRFTTKPGFVVELVAEPDVTGSIVNMTFDTKGRPVISRERGSIYTLIDEDGDGKFEKVQEYSDKIKNCQGLCAWDATTFYAIGEGPDGTGLYRLRDPDGDGTADSVELLHKFKGGMGEHGPHAVVAGPDGYLYINSGNHAWITATPEPGSPVEPYFDLGHLQNDSNSRGRRGPRQGQPADELDRELDVFGKKLPLRDLLHGYEADLLPKYEDANGHAVGIKVPGSSIWQLDPDAKHWSLEVGGFRNQYDFAFNSLGELFTFDSDMEWDEFLPWYRPVAVFHSPPGADHGWRSGSNVGPEYFVDNLPCVVATGRGSPCGVVFYNHTAFPENYHDAFFITDWSYGRIFAVHMKRHGATFQGETEEFVTGKPLNVTDIEVAPDGSLLFTTGGRNTEGGVYRIRMSENKKERPADDKTPVQRALDQPQPQSAWGREAIRQFKAAAGQDWQNYLTLVARGNSAQVGKSGSAAASQIPIATRLRAISYLMQFGPEPTVQLAHDLAKDSNAEIRAQACVLLARHADQDVAAALVAMLNDGEPIVQRRALESLIRTRTAAPIHKLKPLLANKDQFVRYAARLELERIDPAQWWKQLVNDENPRVAIAALVAINRIGWVAADQSVAEAAFAAEDRLVHGLLSSRAARTQQDELDTLRAIQLTLVNSKLDPRPNTIVEIGKLLLQEFPAGEKPLNRELSRTIAAIEVPGAIDKLLREMEKIGSTESLDDRADAIHYARCLVAVTQGWTWEQRQRQLKWFDVSRDWKGGHSYPGYITNFLRDAVKQLNEQELLTVVENADKLQRAAVRALATDERINDKTDAAVIPALAKLLDARDRSAVPRADVLLAIGRTGRAEAEAMLLKNYETSAGAERDVTVRALANFQNARNWPIFVRSLDSENKETVRSALQALAAIDQKPDGPAAFRAAIQAGGRIGDQGAWDSVVLLRQWTGKHFGHKKNEWRAELDKWQKWYAENYPNAQAATLADTAKPRYNWSYDQLLAYLDGEGRSGSVSAGQKIFEKAVCAKCHRIEQVGTSIGPDLTTLTSRFKRKDILEAIIYPSRVISDQYKSYLIATKDGRVITAMKAPDDGDNLVLLLSDASTIKLPKSDVEEMVEGKQSVMPDGLMNEFTLREIADLFAFLESGKAPAAGAM